MIELDIAFLFIHTEKRYISNQCPKLRVNPAPGVHNLLARCTFFQNVEYNYIEMKSYVAGCMFDSAI